MHPDVSKDKRFSKLSELLEDLERDYGLKKEELIDISNKTIPVSIFNDSISPFETIVKYLKENENLSLKAITKITNRSKQGVWQAYNSSKKKLSKKIIMGDSSYEIPLNIISEKKYSVLSSIVKYLREEYSLSYVHISKLIARDQRTVWTAYNRTK